MQCLRAFPPIRGSEHERVKLLLDRGVIETLGPEMSAIAEHDFAAVHEERVIVGGKSGEAFLDRKLAHNRGDRLQFRPVGNIKPGYAGHQTTNETNESRGKENNANSRSHRPRPFQNQLAPQKGQANEIRPDDEFGVVPTPWRSLDEQREEKNRRRRHDESDGGGEPKLSLP